MGKSEVWGLLSRGRHARYIILMEWPKINNDANMRLTSAKHEIFWNVIKITGKMPVLKPIQKVKWAIS